MTPIGKNIIIRTIEEEIKTNSGLILSGEDASGFRYKKGVIVKTGTDVMPSIKDGNEIYYDKTHGYTMVIHDEQYTIISERDIVVVL